MLQILTWDFRGKDAIEKSKKGIDLFLDGMKQESPRRSECVLVQVRGNLTRSIMC